MQYIVHIVYQKRTIRIKEYSLDVILRVINRRLYAISILNVKTDLFAFEYFSFVSERKPLNVLR